MPRRYVTVDVFTDRIFGGNPLAVVLDAQALTAAQMQSIAAEFNYSETTFVLPPSTPEHSAQRPHFHSTKRSPVCRPSECRDGRGVGEGNRVERAGFARADGVRRGGRSRFDLAAARERRDGGSGTRSAAAPDRGNIGVGARRGRVPVAGSERYRGRGAPAAGGLRRIALPRGRARIPGGIAAGQAAVIGS